MSGRSRIKKDGSVEVKSPCPLCGSKDNLETNSLSGVFHCWSCHYSGRRVPTSGGTAPPIQCPRVIVPAGGGTSKEIREDIPEWVRKKVLARNVSAAQLNRLGARWDGRKVIFPVTGGPAWELSLIHI